MKTRHFIAALDHARITAAIVEAERQTSGEIRVFVSHHDVPDALTAARERFAKLGMDKTIARNSVLVFIAPEARKYAVVGDEGIHGKCGEDAFWKSVVGMTMRPLLKEERYTEAIVAAVGEIGRELAAHFPPVAGAQPNELSDAVEEE